LILVVALAAVWRPSRAHGAADTTKSGVADGAPSPALAGERRPLYRLRRSDIVELSFTFAPEFDQTATIQPDGYIALKDQQELYVEGMTLPEVRQTVVHAYATTMHQPEVTVSLKDFDKPYFLAGGQLNHPGKYVLRADITVTEAVAMAGGFNDQARHSQVVLFRRISDGEVESHLLNLKHMLNARNLNEDIHLQPGDMIFVPQNTISKIRRYLPTSNLSLYSSPTQF
jgi:polysaccharide export outer membrane protein